MSLPHATWAASATIMATVALASSCVALPSRDAEAAAALTAMNDEAGGPALEDPRVVFREDRDGTTRVLFLGTSSADAAPLMALTVYAIGRPELLAAWRMAEVDPTAPASVSFYGDNDRSWVFGLVTDPEIVDLQIDYRAAGSRRIPVAPPGFIAAIEIPAPDAPRRWTFLDAHDRARLTPAPGDPITLP